MKKFQTKLNIQSLQEKANQGSFSTKIHEFKKKDFQDFVNCIENSKW